MRKDRKVEAAWEGGAGRGAPHCLHLRASCPASHTPALGSAALRLSGAAAPPTSSTRGICGCRVGGRFGLRWVDQQHGFHWARRDRPGCPAPGRGKREDQEFEASLSDRKSSLERTSMQALFAERTQCQHHNSKLL